MRQILVVLTLAINCLAIKAQSDTPYYTQPNLLKFEGEYVYADGNSSLKVLLKVEKTFVKGPKPFYIDNITGYHVYTKNKAIIQNSIGGNKTIRSGGFVDNSISNKIEFLFIDLKNKKPFRGIIELLPDNKIHWTIKNQEGVRIKIAGQKEEDENIYVPTNLILKKLISQT